jgi:hypothetical protein
LYRALGAVVGHEVEDKAVAIDPVQGTDVALRLAESRKGRIVMSRLS